MGFKFGLESVVGGAEGGTDPACADAEDALEGDLGFLELGVLGFGGEVEHVRVRPGVLANLVTGAVGPGLVREPEDSKDLRRGRYFWTTSALS